jgi:hypothetical protein
MEMKLIDCLVDRHVYIFVLHRRRCDVTYFCHQMCWLPMLLIVYDIFLDILQLIALLEGVAVMDIKYEIDRLLS